MNKNRVKKSSSYVVITCLGAGFGLIFGKYYLENPAMGLIFGYAIGLIIVGVVNYKNKV